MRQNLLSIPWSEDHLQYVRDNAAKLTSEDIAKHVGRSRNAVRSTCRRLKISLIPRYRPWTNRDVFELTSLVERFTVREIAKKMGRTFIAVQHKIDKLNRREGMRLRAVCDGFTLNQAIDKTGYTGKQLFRARRALDMHWRLTSQKRYFITEDQLNCMCSWLKSERPGVDYFWSRVEKRGEDDCWFWSGSKEVVEEGRRYRPASYSWSVHNGKRHGKLEFRIMHTCENHGGPTNSCGDGDGYGGGDGDGEGLGDVNGAGRVGFDDSDRTVYGHGCGYGLFDGDGFGYGDYQSKRTCVNPKHLKQVDRGAATTPTKMTREEYKESLRGKPLVKANIVRMENIVNIKAEEAKIAKGIARFARKKAKVAAEKAKIAAKEARKAEKEAKKASVKARLAGYKLKNANEKLERLRAKLHPTTEIVGESV